MNTGINPPIYLRFLWLLSSFFCSIQQADLGFISKFSRIGAGVSKIINCTAFEILILSCSVLAWRNTGDGYRWTMYPAVLLDLPLSSDSFFVDSLGFSLCAVMPSTSRGSFIFPFPRYVSLFWLLFALPCGPSRISSKTLEWSGGGGENDSAWLSLVPKSGKSTGCSQKAQGWP